MSFLGDGRSHVFWKTSKLRRWVAIKGPVSMTWSKMEMTRAREQVDLVACGGHPGVAPPHGE